MMGMIENSSTSKLNYSYVPRNYECCSLSEWISMHPAETDMQKVFLNMDIALKYIHDHDYCIADFSPSSIFVLKNNPKCIQFVELYQLPVDPIKSKEMIKEDIFMSSLLQICFYMKMPIKDMNVGFLKENFDSFAQFLPSSYVPYYRGVILRGASVYLCEFDKERRKREIANLDKEFGETEGNGRSLVKSSPNRIDVENNNDGINDEIYKQFNGLKDVAFVNYMLIVTIVLFTLFVFGMIGWVLSLF